MLVNSDWPVVKNCEENIISQAKLLQEKKHLNLTGTCYVSTYLGGLFI